MTALRRLCSERKGQGVARKVSTSTRPLSPEILVMKSFAKPAAIALALLSAVCLQAQAPDALTQPPGSQMTPAPPGPSATMSPLPSVSPSPTPTPSPDATATPTASLTLE